MPDVTMISYVFCFYEICMEYVSMTFVLCWDLMWWWPHWKGNLAYSVRSILIYPFAQSLVHSHEQRAMCRFLRMVISWPTLCRVWVLRAWAYRDFWVVHDGIEFKATPYFCFYNLRPSTWFKFLVYLNMGDRQGPIFI